MLLILELISPRCSLFRNKLKHHSGQWAVPASGAVWPVSGAWGAEGLRGSGDSLQSGGAALSLEPWWHGCSY